MTKLEKVLTVVLIVMIVFLSAIALITNPNIVVATKYIDVRFGGLVDVRTFVQPMKVKEITTQEPTIEEIYNLVEAKGYHYTPDSFTLVAYQGTITNDIDFWLYAKESLQLWRTNAYNFYGDCEDGAIFLCSLLRGYGYDARVYVGTVTIDYETYGHAWVEVKVGSQWMLLESTRGEALTTLAPPPSFYHAYYSFTNTNVRYYVISGANEVYPDMPPSLIQQLRILLREY